MNIHSVLHQFFFICLFLLFALPSYAQNKVYVMEVESNAGSVSTFDVDNIKEVRFKEKEQAEELTETDLVKAQYEAGFISAFGLPNPNQDWGFGSNEGIVRIIAEDLSARALNDFDFNDVVFDVEFISNSEAKITLWVVGGTLPLCIGDTNHEIHQLLGISKSTMVDLSKSSTGEPYTFTITGDFKGKAINIPVMVYKSGNWIELSAFQGGVASKIAVTTSYEWCAEYEAITSKYPDFSAWVTDPSVKWY